MGISFNVEEYVKEKRKEDGNFCSKCGSNNPPDSRYCNECGKAM
jgi:ribosomal protein L40E